IPSGLIAQGQVTISVSNPSGGTGSLSPLTAPAVRSINSLNPSSIPLNSGNTPLTVNGGGFTASDRIRIRDLGFNETTNFVNSSNLNTTVPFSFLDSQTSMPVWVEWSGSGVGTG